jgi:hypothetical protein
MEFVAIEPDIGASALYRIGLGVFVVAGGACDLWTADVHAVLEYTYGVLCPHQTPAEDEEENERGGFTFHMLIVFGNSSPVTVKMLFFERCKL